MNDERTPSRRNSRNLSSVLCLPGPPRQIIQSTSLLTQPFLISTAGSEKWAAKQERAIKLASS